VRTSRLSWTRSCPGSRLCWNVELPKVAFKAETQLWMGFTSEEATRVSRLMMSVTFALVWCQVVLRVEMRLAFDLRFAFETLSSVIFRKPTELPLKFLKPRGWLERILKYFGLHIDLSFHDNNHLKCFESDLVKILIFVSVLLNYLKPQERSL